MVKTAVAASRKIWRGICRQIFRQDRTLTLPVPEHPRGQESVAVRGMIEPPPESQRALMDELTENILCRLPEEMDCRTPGRRVMVKLRNLCKRSCAKRAFPAPIWKTFSRIPSTSAGSRGKASSTRARTIRWFRRNCSSACRIRLEHGTNRNTASTTSH